MLRRAVDGLSGAELDAGDRRLLAALADQVAVLQAEMRLQNGPVLTQRCAGPESIVEITTE
jgi:hypothetical protein